MPNKYSHLSNKYKTNCTVIRRETIDLYPIGFCTVIYLDQCLPDLFNHKNLLGPLLKYRFPEVTEHILTYV